MLDPRVVALFKLRFEREFREKIDVMRLATEYGYARYVTHLVLSNRASSNELLANAQRIRIALGRAIVIDPETLLAHL
jgi:hypothetical protein